MDAVEFLKEYKRMCESNSHFPQINLPGANFESTVAEVEQWAKDHPTKARQSEFLKMFPDAYIDDTGVIHICPNAIDTTTKCPINDKVNCNDCRRNYWLQEVE